MTTPPRPRRRYTDEEIDALHEKARRLNEELMQIIAEIVRRAKLVAEEMDDDDDAAGAARAAIEAIGHDNRPASG